MEKTTLRIIRLLGDETAGTGVLGTLARLGRYKAHGYKTAANGTPIDEALATAAGDAANYVTMLATLGAKPLDHTTYWTVSGASCDCPAHGGKRAPDGAK